MRMLAIWAILCICLLGVFAGCKKLSFGQAEKSDVNALAKITTDSSGRKISKLVYYDPKIRGGSYVYRECVQTSSGECSKTEKIDTKDLQREQYENTLKANLISLYADQSYATRKAESLRSLILLKDVLIRPLDLDLASTPFLGVQAVNTDRTQCQVECRSGSSCWSCNANARNASNPNIAIQCSDEHDARLSVANRCHKELGADCEVSCSDLALKSVKPTMKVSTPNPAGDCSFNQQCQPGVDGKCVACSCWSGGLKFRDTLMCNTKAEASSLVLKNCPDDVYCREILGSHYYNERAVDELRALAPSRSPSQAFRLFDETEVFESPSLTQDQPLIDPSYQASVIESLTTNTDAYLKIAEDSTAGQSKENYYHFMEPKLQTNGTIGQNIYAMGDALKRSTQKQYRSFEQYFGNRPFALDSFRSQTQPGWQIEGAAPVVNPFSQYLLKIERNGVPKPLVWEDLAEGH